MKKLLSIILCLSLLAGLCALPALAAEEAWVSDPDYGDPDLCCPPEDSELDPDLLPPLLTDAAPEDETPAAETEAAPAETEGTSAAGTGDTTGTEPGEESGETPAPETEEPPAGTEIGGDPSETGEPAPEESTTPDDGPAGEPAEEDEELPYPDSEYVKDLDPIQIMLADAPADPEITSGFIGETKIFWTVDRETGTLAIVGTGAIPDFREADKADPEPAAPPWYDCRAIITGITVAEGITSIGEGAFARLPLVASLSLPESLTYVGPQAFYYDVSLTAVTLPDGVTEIGESAFANCHALTAVTFSKGLKSIGPWAFDMTTSLGAIDLPEGLETIGFSAFYWNSAVTELTIPGSVKSWGEGAFSLFEALQTVTVDEGVTSLPEGAFRNCYALETLALPSTIRELGPGFVLLTSPDGSPNQAKLKSVTVAERPGYTFNGWRDDSGEPFTNSNIIGRKQIKGSLHAQWTRTYSADTFTDVGEEDWFAPYVEICYATELMNGMTETQFSPNTSATRAQVVTVLWRLAGEPAAENAAPFSDVKEDAWYADALAWAAEDEIAAGYPDGTFLPDNSISRQEFLTLLYRFAMKLKMGPTAYGSGELDAFEDESKVADWALDGESWSVASRLQTGAEEGGKLYLNPTQSIRRSELAAFLARFTDGVPAD